MKHVGGGTLNRFLLVWGRFVPIPYLLLPLPVAPPCIVVVVASGPAVAASRLVVLANSLSWCAVCECTQTAPPSFAALLALSDKNPPLTDRPFFMSWRDSFAALARLCRYSQKP